MKRPHITINCAMSVDGKVALPNKKQVRISNEEDIQRVHSLRNQCDAILVGIGTILTDNPKLTVKNKYVMNPEHPLRVVLDTKGKTPKTALVVNDDAPTIIFTSQKDIKNFCSKTVETIKVRKQSEHYLNLKQILEILYHRGIKKLLVEGGGTVIWNFIKNGLVDDIYIYMGSYIIGGKDTPTLAEGCGVKNEKDLIPLTFINAERLGNGILLHYRKKSAKK